MTKIEKKKAFVVTDEPGDKTRYVHIILKKDNSAICLNEGSLYSAYEFSFSIITELVKNYPGIMTRDYKAYQKTVLDSRIFGDQLFQYILEHCSFGTEKKCNPWTAVSIIRAVYLTCIGGEYAD